MNGSIDSRIVALASDFSQDCLGLSQERYDEIAHGVTLVLHVRRHGPPDFEATNFELHQNAWSVNFVSPCRHSSPRTPSRPSDTHSHLRTSTSRPSSLTSVAFTT
mgnify:CR=1 FL=1